jgi:aminobenzoyl-glutamate transport protein
VSVFARVERIGNALPDPATLFLLGALAVMGLSQLAVALDWSVEKTETRERRVAVRGPDGAPVLDPASGAPLTLPELDPATGAPLRERVSTAVRPFGLLSSDGLWWALSSMVDNFKTFPPLGIVLVGMLGIGLAERSGLVAAALRAVLAAMPTRLLTPALVFAGVMSSLAVDAGYVVLPPIAMALYRAAGRSPLAGLAAVFAGVAGGFSANLSLTALDPMVAGLSEAGARIVAPHYRVAPTSNWWFMIASTFLLVGVGWWVTARVVEPRYRAAPPDEGGPDPDPAAAGAAPLSPAERLGLRNAALAALAVLALAATAAAVPGGPLHGRQGHATRWVVAIVPLLFLFFSASGLVYGITAGSVRRDRDAARMLGETMAGLGPYIVLAFFAAQFVEYFRKSGLGEMLALTGGAALARAELPATLLVVAFVGVTTVANLFVGSLSAKYAFMAPVFVPMLMQVGISPELTQAAYRIGDSISNIITPLNPYVVIVLTVMQRHVPRAGIGTLVALMLPYTLAFGAAWTALLLLWMALGLPLGPEGPLWFTPAPLP